MVSIQLELDESVKSKVEEASTLLGWPNIEAYVLKLIDEDASRVIAEHQNIPISDEEFDSFWDVCEQGLDPNSALLKAKADTKE
ncbi:DUF1778 domain-containing protein [Shewanella sp. 202IG2-18]|uniref:type II toxin -antitoxin system TacA 1-like antitoxin n=1 Tax=Parashewanella hymeniacidonis TaxID=2807618 RepID=UPI0019606982|nr:DUF1778 domain-containing protein [Parashewanella hymeniacidonis]MBM7074432.1 DUF1778 domain-containing protein [Parashewanella hymeniacidonis]